jgi:CDP-diacylglycerol--serine O-phosphatidyltransferase
MKFQKRRNKQMMLKELHFGKMLPNLATLTALFVGLSQIKFSLQEQWEYAILAVVGAAILDATDGRLARMLGVCSRFGAELDSLSDLIAFGVCPAITLYLFSLQKIDRIGWVVCVFFAMCMALRLARFNVCDIENITTELSKKGFSVGVPAPAGAILNLFPIILYNAFELELFKSCYICLVWSIISSLLCVSKIPTFTIKKLHIKKEQYMIFLIDAIIAASVVFIYTWKAFSVIVLLYIGSIFYSRLQAKSISLKQNGQILNSK